MSPAGSLPPEGNLLFHWERPSRRRYAIVGFLVASAALHALCFYLFQVVYPPAISLLPPPAQISVIAPSQETRAFLEWLEAEDPATASQTQRPEDARAFQLPKLTHLPSYLAVPPALRAAPSLPTIPETAAAMPPAPVPSAPPSEPTVPLLAPTRLLVAGELGRLPMTHPALNFQASLRETPQASRFRMAVQSSGEVRYVFLEQSSGDAALDLQARQILALTRFRDLESLGTKAGLRWVTASFEFGNDLALPPTPAGGAP